MSPSESTPLLFLEERAKSRTWKWLYLAGTLALATVVLIWCLERSEDDHVYIKPGILVDTEPLKAAENERVVFAVLGDWGRKGNYHQQDVADAMGDTCHDLQCSFVISTGDNFYKDGVDSVDDKNWRHSFEDIYTAKSLDVPWHITLGNHDYRGKPTAQIDYTQLSSRWRLPSRYYSFDKHSEDGRVSIRFFIIDTNPFISDYFSDPNYRHSDIFKQDTAAQMRWLEDELRHTDDSYWKIVVGHHPVYSAAKTHGDSRDLVSNLLPQLETYGVHAYLCGHDHDLQHIKKHKMHFLVSGAGSRTRSGVELIDELFFESHHSGFMLFSVSKHHLHLQVYSHHNKLKYQTKISKKF